MAANLLATNGHLGMERIKSRALQRDQRHLEIKVFVFLRSFCVLKTNVDYFSVKLLGKYFGLTFDYKVSLSVWHLGRKEGPIIRDQKDDIKSTWNARKWWRL